MTFPAPLVDWLLAGLSCAPPLPPADLSCVSFEILPLAFVEEPKAESLVPQLVCLLIHQMRSLQQLVFNVEKNILLFLPRN